MATINAINTGKPIEVESGGTGAATLTDHGILVGSGTGAVSITAEGASGEVLIGTTSSDPVWLTAGTSNYILTAHGAGTLPTWEAGGGASGVTSIVGDSGTSITGVTTLAGGTNITTSSTGVTATVDLDAAITLTTVNATTFDTDIAAAGVTLAGTTLAADGTDANISVTVTPKGTGDLTLTTGDVLASTGDFSCPTGDVIISSTSGTSSSSGRIFIGPDVVLHKMGSTFNIFLGANSGNYTMSGATYNTGAGYSALNDITSAGFNTSIGANTCSMLTSGQQNSAFGDSALYKLTTGAYNIAFGNGAGYNYATSESSNLLIGNNSGTVGESNVMRIGKSGTGNFQQNKCYIGGIYNSAVGATAGVVLSDSADLTGGLAGAVGEVFVGGTKPSFLTAGTANHVLTADGAGNAVAWEYSHALPLTLEAQTGTTYTLVLADAGKLVTLTNASAIALTIPLNTSVAFPIGTEIQLYNGDAGLVTVAGESGVTLVASGSKVKLEAQHAIAKLVKLATDTWVITGATTTA